MPTTLDTAIGSSGLRRAEEYVRNMLADCPTWRTMCSATTHAAARARTYRRGLPDPSNGLTFTAAEMATLYPYAIVEPAAGEAITRRRVASDCFDESGRTQLLIFRAAAAVGSDGESTPASMDAFDDLAGRIVDELCALGPGGAHDYVEIESAQIEALLYSDGRVAAEQGAWEAAEITLEW